MSDFYHAIHTLIQSVELAESGVTRCTLTLENAPHFGLIDWLDAQPVFPKFYWQSRDMREEVVALGQLHAFLDPAPAYHILSEGQRVWGGRSFDGKTEKNPRCMSSFFFLPQVELIRQQDSWCLAANITSDKTRTLNGLKALKASVQSLMGIESHIRSLHHCPQEQGWDTLIQQALHEIETTQVKKIVLARETTLTLEEPIKPAQLLKVSAENNHNSYHFMLVLDNKHSFLGSTPERLYQRVGKTLITEALAGTIGRGDTAGEDMELANWLKSDAKNLRENQYVVDDIIERLESCADDIHVERDVQVVKLRKVQHLRRIIQAELKSGINGVQLLGALQPTAAVSGLPRKEAKEFIELHEPFARGWYAGSIGFISHEKAEFCVAIRSALVQDNIVKLYAGAGILPGSESAPEWAELDRKVSTLLSLITDKFPLGVAS
ncbi:isochorismate synthase [Vibrio viridaestus]|uniref:Isochorismate synthase MenF n=1 Tax=Vibrio viridaestus TaxID=2487322 RepID=A0A3N9TK92_9VIBR|nr:isochorismate synthase [Vibrio viridaestus]RQW64243.1 isochorismate synthase [Vibrio viridaestus]